MTARQDTARALQPHAGLRARAFVYLLRAVNARYELWIAERKRALLGSLRGTILEIGPGAGVNLGYYAPGVTWIGIEPNVYMQPYLRREAKAGDCRWTCAPASRNGWKRRTTAWTQ